VLNETLLKYTLAIESAVGGGSISLQAEEDEVDCWIGDSGVSRAEDLLPNIIEMLDRRRVDRNMIGRIAISVGPGSYTGIRIGIAAALGLKSALDIPCVGVPVLEAMALASASVGTVLTVVPMGRRSICFQTFNVSGDGQAEPASEPVACGSIDESPSLITGTQEILVHESLLTDFQNALPDRIVRSIGSNLAKLIGLASIGREATDAIKPIFLTSTV